MQQTISLGDIARKNKIDPKVARAKMRRFGSKIKTSGDGWVFSKSDEKKVLTALTTDHRKKS